jgi:hypothetical protein
MQEACDLKFYRYVFDKGARKPRKCDQDSAMPNTKGKNGRIGKLSKESAITRRSNRNQGRQHPQNDLNTTHDQPTSATLNDDVDLFTDLDGNIPFRPTPAGVGCTNTLGMGILTGKQQSRLSTILGDTSPRGMTNSSAAM